MISNKRRLAARIVYVIGMLAAILPPAIAFLERFPVLKEKNYDAVVSWFAVLMLFVCTVPFWRKLKEMLKSPDATFLWLAIFIIFAAIRNIVDGMIVVAFCGLCGNLAARLMFTVSRVIEAREHKEDKE